MTTSTLPHKHQIILANLVRKGALSLEQAKAVELVVYHDDWCAYLKGGRCHCKPRIELEGKIIYGK